MSFSEENDGDTPLDHFRAHVDKFPGLRGTATPPADSQADREYRVDENLRLLTGYVDHLLVRVAELEARLQQAGMGEFHREPPSSAYDTKTGRYKPNES